MSVQLRNCRYYLGLQKFMCNSLFFFKAVYFKKPDDTYEILMAGPSHFSPELIGEKAVRERIIYADPLMLCSRKC